MPKIIHGVAPEATSHDPDDRIAALERQVNSLVGVVHQLAAGAAQEARPNPAPAPPEIMHSLYLEQKKENQKLREENQRLADPASQLDRLNQLQSIMPKTEEAPSSLDTLIAIAGAWYANTMEPDEPAPRSEPPADPDEQGDPGEF